MNTGDDRNTKQLSILHISDLHRNPLQWVSNDALLNSLENDLNRYSREPFQIPKPNLIVVSGDIVKGLEEKEPLDNIYLQYDEAAKFLSGLADIFLGGDKEKIVIAPGNHDVCWYYSRASMKQIQIQDKEESQIQDKGVVERKRRLFKIMIEGDSNVRWSWNTFEFLQIEDQALYQMAFEPFSIFYANFYEGKRNYTLAPADQYDIFDYPDINTTVVAFNSCYNNDHCNTVGRIHFDCISKAIRKLRAPQYFGRLLIAVWHHNVKGSPLEANYMDSRCLKNLIEAGFSLGFHGHQHQTEVIEEYLSCLTGDKSYFISAGTLCGSRYQLPSGKPRQYNIVQVDQAQPKAIVHVREMKESCFELPIWGPGSLGMENKSSLSIQLQKSNIQIGREITMGSYLRQIAEAERLIGNREYNQALEILKDLNDKDEVVRRLRLECYINLRDNKGIISLCYPPQTDTEIVYCLDALWEEGEVDKLKNLLECDKVRHSDSKLIEEAQAKYSKRLKTKKAL
jgi:predicted MPP superfamily phosphohydrolase